VHRALAARGLKLALSPEIVAYQHRQGLRLGAVLQEFFIWGRSYAVTRCRLLGAGGRVSYLLLSPLLPVLLCARMLRNVLRKRRCVGRFLVALPLTFLLSLSWSLGEFVGYLRGAESLTSDRPCVSVPQ
jgi:hypothetical protein